MRNMKKYLSFLLVVVILLSMASPVWAQEGPRFEIGAYTGEPGDTIQVPVLVKNNPGIASIKLMVAYDDTRLELTGVTYGSWDGNFMPPRVLVSPISLTWLDSSANYTVSDSTFATLTFRILDNAKAGDATITMTYDPNNVYNIQETNLNFAIINGVITVNSASPNMVKGDVTGDDKVTNADTIRMARYLLDAVTLTEDQIAAGDVTGDGRITNADVIKLARYVLGAVEQL